MKIKRDIVIPVGTEFKNCDGMKAEYVSGNFEAILEAGDDACVKVYITEDIEFSDVNLSFGEALSAISNGHKIKVPEWNGYWFKESGMVKVMTAEGEVLDTPHFQQYIFRKDWQIVK